ncbi:MAG TPA: CHASE2 domain-containing protein, partial [Thermoleophilaceae bacterium]|nr:CHASE2 domain-containing protein [Thermoleophilaceae bacterium]
MGRAPLKTAPWRALASIAVLAVAVALAAQAAGALGGLERATEEARFEIRGADRPDDVAVVAIDAQTFGDLREQWPFPRSMHGKVLRRLKAAGAREVVYDVQFTEPSQPREDEALYRALGDTGGAVLATSESDGRGGTQVLGGDENLRAVDSRAAASDLTNTKGSVTRFPREVAGLDTLATAAAKRAGGSPL